MLQILVLGPLEVRRDGLLVQVPGGKSSELLVRLALEAGVRIRADRLVDDLWTADIGAIRRNTLQAKVTLLRRALGDVIVGGDGGYTLAVDPSSVDAQNVVDDVGEASRLLDAGDDRSAAELCEAALRMFHGEVLPAAGDGAWVIPQRVRLEDARLRLIDLRFSALLRLGGLSDVIGELEAAVATYPFREHLWELLITALYGAGRQADALSSYQRIRTRLADELGLEPGPALRQLEQRILRQDPSLGIPSRDSGAAPETLSAENRSAAPRVGRAAASRGNLPSLTVELVGRRSEVDTIAALLGDNRLVEIVGPGGIGKTAVAIAIGRGLTAPDGVGSDGVWLARLETATTRTDVSDTLIAAVDNPGGEDALVERLRDCAAVVILDNCEHVIDAAAALATRLLDAAPELRILCTSQVPLDIDGEVVVELAPLTLSAAAELFTRRAVAPRLSPASSTGDSAVLELCRSLDGLPLAIELAAARTRTLSIEDITRRLDNRFAVLSDPNSRRAERRRSLKSTIRWSYDLLFPDDQRGLWALATFAGGAPLPAVEFVVEALEVPAAAALDVVDRLVSRSLVIVDDDGAPANGADGVRGQPIHAFRYRMLDSIRAFALDELTAEGLNGRAFSSHAAWFAEAARSSTEGVRSSQQARFLSFARRERANIDAALGWCAANDPVLAVTIATGFGWAWVVLGDSRGAQRILAALDAAGAAVQDRDRIACLLLAGWIEASSDHLDRALEHVAAATEFADSLGDVDLQARCLYYLAYVVSHHGEFRRAMELTERSSALYDGLNRPWDQAATWLFAARAAISAGDQARAEAAVEQVRRWLRVVDDPWLGVRGEAIFGELARIQHRFDDAVVHIRRAAETSGRLGFQQTEAYQLFSLGRANCQAGDRRAGLATLELAVDKAEATGDVRLAALARVHVGRVLRAQRRPAAARAAIERAASWHRAAGGGEQAALAECLLAALDAADGIAGAHQRLSGVLDGARMNADAPVEVFALDALARIAAESGDLAAAEELSETADRRMVDASAHITEADRVDAQAVRSVVGGNDRGRQLTSPWQAPAHRRASSAVVGSPD